MIKNICETTEIFLFVLSILNILKNLYSVLKVLARKDGKIDSSTINTTLFGLSLSYAITALIMWF